MEGEHPAAFHRALCSWICPSVLEHGQDAGRAPWPVAWVTLPWKRPYRQSTNSLWIASSSLAP